MSLNDLTWNAALHVATEEVKNYSPVSTVDNLGSCVAGEIVDQKSLTDVLQERAAQSNEHPET